MIRTNELRGIISKNGHSQSSVARALGITPKTFYEKMNKGVFSSTEIQAMTELLNIENPWSIFFADDVAQHATNDSEQVS